MTTDSNTSKTPNSNISPDPGDAEEPPTNDDMSMREALEISLAEAMKCELNESAELTEVERKTVGNLAEMATLSAKDILESLSEQDESEDE